MASKTTFINEASGGGQFAPESGGQFAPDLGGQVRPERGGQFERIFHARQEMVNIVNKDNGKGGTKQANNREYGGTVSNSNEVEESIPGPVSSPVQEEANMRITINQNTKSIFHSHSSGTLTEILPDEKNGNIMAGPKTNTFSYQQPPSSGKGKDIHSSNESRTNYVFARGEKVVYIYDSQKGILATLPQNNFVNFK